MALPDDATVCTVSFGPYTDAEGLAALVSSGGKLTTVAADTGKPINVTHVATGQVILPKAVDITIGSDGTSSVGPIPHTDNPGLSPVGFAYRVEWNIASNKPSPRNKTFALPQAKGATADFDLLDEAEAVPGVLVPIGEGPQGDPGLTAYEVAVAGGFVGTEAAWLASLKGEQGDPGDPSVTPEAVAANLPARLSDEELRAAFVRRRLTPPLYATAPTDFRQIPVVMIHNLVSLADGQGRLKDYISWGYEPIFFSQLVDYLRTGDATGLPEKPICITVDDAGLSGYSYLFPALTEFNFKATYFIVPAWINGDITAPPNGGNFLEASPFTWANAVEMQASGRVEFQSHTLTHGSMRLLSGPGQFTGAGEGAGADFLAAKAMIEAHIPGANVKHSAAPYGVINQTALDSLAAAGCIGQRITAVGKDNTGIYDGSGPFSWTIPGTDPMLVPVTDSANFNYMRRANKYGEADRDGNLVQNGRFLVSQRGWTLPAGWSQTSLALPQGTGTGPVLRGFGTGAATMAQHTDMIPVGLYNAFAVDWWLQATAVPANSARCIVYGYLNPTDTTPTRTLTDVDSNNTWKRKRWNHPGYSDVAWIKVGYDVLGATASSEMLIWDVKVRRHRTVYSSSI